MSDKISSRLSSRITEVTPFYVMELMAEASRLESKGLEIIHMEVGEPDFLAPEPVKIAAQNALNDGNTKYTSALGIIELREKVSEFYYKKYGINVPASRVAITFGATGAIILALASFVNPGEKVLVSDPGYPCNKNFISMLNGIPVAVPVDSSSNYQFSYENVVANWDSSTKGIIVSTPSNPTGTLISPEELKKIIDFVNSKNGFVIVDEIYHGLVYQDDVKTALTMGDDFFVANSFSKYFGMTGWRLGWLVAPEGIIDYIEKLAQNIFISPQTISQYAGVEAFSEESIRIYEQRRAVFQERRDYLIPALREIGFVIDQVPEGAFYLYADCSKFTDDSYQFCFDLLRETGVAITPGKDFGSNNHKKYVRFAYANSLENLKKGVGLISKYVSGK